MEQEKQITTTAKIFRSILKRGRVTVFQISEDTGVKRNAVYQRLNQLQGQGRLSVSSKPFEMIKKNNIIYRCKCKYAKFFPYQQPYAIQYVKRFYPEEFY